MKKKFVCTVCGYIHEGSEPPAQCPQCKAPASKFKELVETELTFVTEHVIGIAKDVDPEIKKGLQANFEGECTEVGMYLAMTARPTAKVILKSQRPSSAMPSKRPTTLRVSASCWATWFGTRRPT